MYNTRLNKSHLKRKRSTKFIQRGTKRITQFALRSRRVLSGYTRINDRLVNEKIYDGASLVRERAFYGSVSIPPYSPYKSLFLQMEGNFDLRR
jgi:hypothetical protein